MANELVTYARLRGARVHTARSYGGKGAPYWPWIQAIGAYVNDRKPEALLSEMRHGDPYIAQVVSERQQ